VPTAAPAPPALDPRKLKAFGVALLGTFATVLGGQLVTADLADIQGSLGVSADEASWISTIFPVTQVLMVTLAAPLALALGVRRFLLILTGLFLLSCALAARSRTLEGEVVLRLLQGLAAGGFGTATFSLVFRTFAGRNPGPGLATLALATTFPITIGLPTAAVLTDTWGWPAIYVLDAVAASLVLFGVYRYMDTECFHPTVLEKLDWGGFVLLAPGLGLLMMVLSQGDRRYWTETEWIGVALALSAVLLTAFVVLETHRSNPLMNLLMLVHPNFGVACLLNFMFRISLLGTSVLLPRFLTDIGGYRDTEMAPLFLIPLLMQPLLYPAVYAASRRLDPRWLLALGFALLATAAILDGARTAASAAPEFLLTQALAGLAPPLVIVSLLLLGTRGVRPEDSASAGVLWNVSLTLGSTGGAGLAASAIRARIYHHSNHLNDFLSTTWAPVANRLDDLSASLGARIADDEGAQTAAVTTIANATHAQSEVLAITDVSIAVGVIALLALLIVPLVPRWTTKGVAR